MLLWFLLSLPFTSSLDLAEDEGVLSLTDHTFALAEMRYESLFVHFHAPLCSICRNVTSDMRRVADSFRGEFPAFRMAEIDVAAEGGVGRRFGVVGVPTVLFLEKGRRMDYQGELSAKAVERWVLAALRTGVDTINTSEELTRFTESSNFTVVLFADPDSPILPALKNVSLDSRAPPIAHCPSPDAYPPYSNSFPLLMLFNGLEDVKYPYTGPWDQWSLGRFIGKKGTRMNARWDDSAADYLFAKQYPVLFYFRTEGSAVTIGVNSIICQPQV